MSGSRALAVALGATLALAAPARAQPGVVAGSPIDGPGPDVAAVGGVAMSRDGSGAVAYLKRDGGVVHAFVARESGGSFSPPERVDAGLAGPASGVVVAAADGGRLAVAYLEGATLYAAVAPTAGAPFSSPELLATLSGAPSISMSLHGAAYISFSTPGPPSQVRVAHAGLGQSAFTVLDGALNNDPTRNAGASASSRSQIAASADGTAMVVWGEDGADGRAHVYERRVLRNTIGAPPQDAGLSSFHGHAGGSADSPSVRVADNSGFADVTLRQAFDDGHEHAIGRTLRGDAFDGQYELDPLAFPANDDATASYLDVNGGGGGVAVTGLAVSHELFYTPLGNGAFAAAQRADSVANALAPSPVAALGYNGVGLIAWQQATSAGDVPTIRARAISGGASLGPEIPISNPAQGPVDASNGLAAAADGPGDALVAFVQGSPGARSVAVAVQAQPPQSFAIAAGMRYRATHRPRIAWGAARDAFGTVHYVVSVDGHALGTTSALNLPVPRALPDGAHRLVVAAIDQRGLQMAVSMTIIIDTRAPRVTISRRGGDAVVTVVDPLPRVAAGRRASGVARVRISWGDGSSTVTTRSAQHRLGAGHSVSVVAADRAGNVTRAHRRL